MRKAFKFRQKNSLKQITPVLVVLVVAIFGIILIIVSHASTPYVSITADKGTITPSALVNIDSTASDGKSVMFGNAATGGGKVLWYADGTRPISQEWTSYSFWPSQYCGGTFASGSMPPSNLFQVESSFVPPSQTHAYHFTLLDNSPCFTGNDRGEINMGNNPRSPWVAPDGITRDQVQGQNSWIAYWFYIPTHLTSNPSQPNVMGGAFPYHGILQWHNYGNGGPPLGVEAFDSNKMDVGEQNCHIIGCSNGGPVGTWSYTRDKWLKLLLHVNWSANSDGYVEVYGDMGDGQGFHQLTQRYTRWILKTDASGNGAPVFPVIGNYETGCQANPSFCGTSEDYALGPYVGTTEQAVTQKAFGF